MIPSVLPSSTSSTAQPPLPPPARPRLRSVSLALSLAVAVLAGCAKEAPPAAAAPVDPLLVSAAPELAGILKVGPATSQPLAETLRVAGRLDFDEQRVIRIGAPVTGRVTDIRAILGQQVKAGEVLARLNSTELGQAQLAFLKASGNRGLAQRAAERARVLYQSDVIAAAELQRRENEFAMGQAESRAAADQLKVLGMSAKAIEQLAATGAIASFSPVVATLAGSVVERQVTLGQVVQPADALFTVADLSRLWAVAEVPEQQAALVSVGQSVNIEVPALGEQLLTGKLINISDTVNPETRTVRVRTELANPGQRLKPAMLATMLITSKPVARLAVPAAAIVRENNGDHLFVQVAPNQFRLTAVTLGSESRRGEQAWRPVLGGLKEGALVVVEGAFHLNNERKRKELEGN